jgi:very-short-patch-repair endonuclease
MLAEKKNSNSGELLVAILKEVSDFGILKEQGWYRIPVGKAPRRWPPKWLAFYQPNAFGADAFKIRYYGEVDDIQIVKRQELFPTEFESELSFRKYYRLYLKSLRELPAPISIHRFRRLVFISTTWEKFLMAEQINDLFDESPIEDHLWNEFKRLKIDAERQWGMKACDRYYQLDFALFCNQGQIDIETDGDTWHAQRERIPLDNQRDNDIQSAGWHVLRFNGGQVREKAETYCIRKIEEMANRLGGLKEEKLVPRKFFPKPGAQQPSLFETEAEYRIDGDDDLVKDSKSLENDAGI